MADLTSCRISLLSRIVYMETILSRVSLPVQNLAHHMMYTDYVVVAVKIVARNGNLLLYDS